MIMPIDSNVENEMYAPETMASWLKSDCTCQTEIFVLSHPSMKALEGLLETTDETLIYSSYVEARAAATAKSDAITLKISKHTPGLSDIELNSGESSLKIDRFLDINCKTPWGGHFSISSIDLVTKKWCHVDKLNAYTDIRPSEFVPSCKQSVLSWDTPSQFSQTQEDNNSASSLAVLQQFFSAAFTWLGMDNYFAKETAA